MFTRFSAWPDGISVNNHRLHLHINNTIDTLLLCYPYRHSTRSEAPTSSLDWSERRRQQTPGALERNSGWGCLRTLGRCWLPLRILILSHAGASTGFGRSWQKPRSAARERKRSRFPHKKSGRFQPCGLNQPERKGRMEPTVRFELTTC